MLLVRSLRAPGCAPSECPEVVQSISFAPSPGCAPSEGPETVQSISFASSLHRVVRPLKVQMLCRASLASSCVPSEGPEVVQSISFIPSPGCAPSEWLPLAQRVTSGFEVACTASLKRFQTLAQNPEFLRILHEKLI